MRLQSGVEQLEDKLLRMEIAKNNHVQYTQCNNIEIQAIPATVADDHLDEKLILIYQRSRIVIDLITQRLKYYSSICQSQIM